LEKSCQKRENSYNDTLSINKIDANVNLTYFSYVARRAVFCKQNRKIRHQCLPLVGSVCCKWVSLGRGQRKKEKTRKETTFGDLFSCWLPLTCWHVFGHRTMRQTLSLTALVGRISFEILPPVRAFGAQGGAFEYRRGKGKTKAPRRLPRGFVLAYPNNFEPLHQPSKNPKTAEITVGHNIKNHMYLSQLSLISLLCFFIFLKPYIGK